LRTKLLLRAQLLLSGLLQQVAVSGASGKILAPQTSQARSCAPGCLPSPLVFCDRGLLCSLKTLGSQTANTLRQTSTQSLGPLSCRQSGSRPESRLAAGLYVSSSLGYVLFCKPFSCILNHLLNDLLLERILQSLSRSCQIKISGRAPEQLLRFPETSSQPLRFAQTDVTSARKIHAKSLGVSHAPSSQIAEIATQSILGK
jgi:hypothetical protein